MQILKKLPVKKLVLPAAILATLATIVSVTYAAFSDSAQILGSKFSISSADLRFEYDPTIGSAPDNLVDTLEGPSFGNIGQNWSKEYALKMINNGTTRLNVNSYANYETENDPESLRSDISVEIFEWNDSNSDGVLDPGETGMSKGKKTIVKWKTEGFDLGDFYPGQGKFVVLKFTTENISETKQGAQALFDFNFESIQM